MIPETPRTPREEQEVRLVALLLGELPADQEAALRQQLAGDPELQRFHDELQRTLPLVREAAEPISSPGTPPQPPLRLADSRRDILLGQFRTVPLPKAAPPSAPTRRRDRAWILPMSLAACLTALLGLLVLGPRSEEGGPMFGNSYALFDFGSVARSKEPTMNPESSVVAKDLADGLAAETEGIQVRLGEDRNKVVNSAAGLTSLATAAPASPAPTSGPRSAGAVRLWSYDAKEGDEVLGRHVDLAKDAAFKKEKSDVQAGQGLGVPDPAANAPVVAVVPPQSTVAFGVPVAAFAVPPPAPAPASAPAGGRKQLTEERVVTKGVEPLLAKRYGLKAKAEAPVAGKSLSAASARPESPQRALVEAESKTKLQAASEARGWAIARGAAPEGRVTQQIAGGAEQAEKQAGVSVPALGDVPVLGERFLRSGSSFGGGLGGGSGGAGGVEVAGKVVGDAAQTLGFEVNGRGNDNSEARSGGATARYGHFEYNLSESLAEQAKQVDKLARTLNRDEARANAPAKPALEHYYAELGGLQTNVVLPAVELDAILPARTTTQLSIAEQAVEDGIERKGGMQLRSRLNRVVKQPAPIQAPAVAPPTPPDEDGLNLQRRAAAPAPQPEVATSDNAFSTFSLNVSDVSFKLADASLQSGSLPDPGTVRTEEFLNALDYRDPEPPAGMPVAFHWEQARYPFAHNRDLLRFSVKTAARGREPGRALNLVLLLDNSGSMERADRVSIIRECLRVLAGQLSAQDKLSIITFSRTAQLRTDGVSGAQAPQEIDKVTGLTPEGGTNLEEALGLAYATARRHFLSGGVNRVVMLTDGAANLGNVDPESLKRLVETHRSQGIALDSFGIGWEGYADDLLEVLTRNGDGRYGFINTPEEAASGFAGQLAGALQVAASDVKVQVEFNPRRVTVFRQLGYAKHQLKKEQFRDNTVDAAEIGAAESGNALYLVEVNPRGEGDLATVRVRFKVPGTSDYREHAWTVPYRGQTIPLAQAPASLRLAAVAGAFAEWLVASPFAGDVTPDALLGLLSGAPEHFGADSRPQRLEWMIRQAKSLSGK